MGILSHPKRRFKTVKMGCCSSSKSPKPPHQTPSPNHPSKKVAVTCEYQGQREVFNTANLATIRDQLKTKIPALTFKAVRLVLKGKELTSSEELLRELESSGNKASVAVEIETGLQAKDAAERQMLASVLILAQGEVVIGTGIAVRKDLVLCAAEDLEQRVRQDTLRLVCPGDKEQLIRLNKGGICLKLTTVDKVQICLIQPIETVTSPPNFRFDQAFATENVEAKCVFVRNYAVY